MASSKKRGKYSRCVFCQKEYLKSGMLKHLKICKNRQLEVGKQEYFTMVIDSPYMKEYYLIIEIATDATLETLDNYIRSVWVECCGHLSLFDIYGEEYYSSSVLAEDMNMKVKLNNVLVEGNSFSYEYDFGTTTELNLLIKDNYTGKKRKDKIRLLAQNIMPECVCIECGEPAVWICAICASETPENTLCDKCAGTHECGEEVMLPVVNSPRAGVCGYCGGIYDEEEA